MSSDRAAGGVAVAAALSLLVFLLPFEAREPIVRLAGLGVTALEALAGTVIVWLLAHGRRAIPPLLRRPPAPLVGLAAFALAHLLSAAFAQEQRGRAALFALRMVAAAAFALAVAVAPRGAPRRGLGALCAAALAVALLAALELGGVRGVDRFLDLFRQSYVLVGDSRRATAGSEHPNLAGAFLMYGLLAGIGLASARARWLGRVLALSLVLGGGLLLTYSRGAALAALTGLLVQALALARRASASWAAPLVSAGALVVLGAAAAAREPAFALRAIGQDDLAAWYRARVEPGARTLSLSPGERRELLVKVTNTGQRTWAGAGHFILGYHWYEQGWKSSRDGFAAPLPADLAPGQSLTLTATVKAPEAEGSYALVWDMVHTQVGWFSRAGGETEAMPARVARDPRPEPPEPVTIAPPLPGAWRPDRAELWKAALGMWAEHPLLGVGPDNFRKMAGRRAGRPDSDVRTYANSAFLEVAATTGSLGLLAFLVTLLATAIGCARRMGEAAQGPAGSAVAAALLALTAGVTLHGLTDYVLAFTGHYLLLGFLVGSAAHSGGAARSRA